MIRRAQDGAFLLIPQHDHAVSSGKLAEHVGNGRFARPEPRDAVLRGVSLHDGGWPLHDEQPTLNPQHLPFDVFESKPEVAMMVWRASVERAAGGLSAAPLDEAEGASSHSVPFSCAHPYAGLLVSLHVLALSRLAIEASNSKAERSPAHPNRVLFEVNKFQHKQIEIQEQFRRQLGLATDQPLTFGLAESSSDPREQQLIHNFRLLQALDQISLAACCTQPPADHTTPLPPRPAAAPVTLSLKREGNDVWVDPWPFDVDQIPCSIPFRRIPSEPFEDEPTFRRVYAAAPVEKLSLLVRRG